MGEFLDFISTAGDTLGSLLNFGYGIYQDQRNFNYSKELQQQLWQRDDNAMQRRMADFGAAGLNPLLALGSSSAGNTSFPVGSASTSAPINNVFEKQAKKVELEILNKKQTEQDYVNNSLWLKNEEQKLKNKLLESQVDTLDNLGFYPYSAAGKWITDINSGLGSLFGNPSPNYLNPLNLLGSIFPNIFNPSPFPSPSSKPNTVIPDTAGKVKTQLQNAFHSTKAEYRESNKSNEKLAHSLNNAWKDSGFVVNYHNGKFTVENFNVRPPIQADFETYQQASQYIWSFVN